MLEGGDPAIFTSDVSTIQKFNAINLLRIYNPTINNIYVCNAIGNSLSTVTFLISL